VALLLAGFTAWLSIRQVSWPTLQELLAHPDLPLLALALGTVLATTAAKAARWSILLRQCNAQASGWRILRVLFIGQMLNTFVPRLGDLGRAVLLGPQAPARVPAVLGTVFVEKALDGLMGLLLLGGLVLWTPLPVWLRGPILALASITAILLALLIMAASQHLWAVRLYQGITSRLPSGLQNRTRRLLAEFGQGLSLLESPFNTVQALAWSAVVWALAASTNYVVLAALGIEAPAWSSWLVLVAVYVATFLPTVPTHVGVFEYACVLALTAAGVDPAPAFAFGLILHLLVYIPPALIGPVCMGIEGLNWSGLKQAERDYLER
jgi:uncharacterized protein (TIRG00374 family)